MNILMITNIDNDEKLEDIWLARAFQEDGHNVAIVDKNYDEKLESIFDIFLKRNTWNSNATIENVSEKYSFTERIIKKDLPRINFDGKYDGSDKSYLVKLFKNGYETIPTIDNLDDLKLLKNTSKYMMKRKESYDGIGQLVLEKEELKSKFNNSYIIQPFMKFKSEVQFYYIKDKLEYVLEFIPSKVPVYPKAIKYEYNSDELELANKFACLNAEYYGIQRIDFIKLEDDTLLLTEIEDISPYLDLNQVDKKTKEKFIIDYKNMVYEYMQNKNVDYNKKSLSNKT